MYFFIETIMSNQAVSYEIKLWNYDGEIPVLDLLLMLNPNTPVGKGY